MATVNPIVTGLTNYVEEKSIDLLTKSMLGGNFRKRMNLQTGVKSDVALSIMDVDPEFQALSCGWSESGSTEFSQRILKPVGLEVLMAFCSKNLLKTWANYQVKVTAGLENLPFEEKWTGQIVDAVNEKLDKMVFQGASGQTNEFEGLISILDGDANSVKVNVASGTSMLEAVRQVAAAIPAKVKNPKILLAKEDYFTFITECVKANLYHYEPNEYKTDGTANSYKLPGTDIEVIAVEGLIGSHKIIAANLDNLYYGISADGDEDTFMLFYEPSEREFRLVIQFVAGVQVAFPDEVVIATLN